VIIEEFIILSTSNIESSKFYKVQTLNLARLTLIEFELTPDSFTALNLRIAKVRQCFGSLEGLEHRGSEV
jgi:hypothetical protein